MYSLRPQEIHKRKDYGPWGHYHSVTAKKKPPFSDEGLSIFGVANLTHGQIFDTQYFLNVRKKCVLRYLEWSQIAFIVLSILSHGAATVVYVSCRKIFLPHHQGRLSEALRLCLAKARTKHGEARSNNPNGCILQAAE